MAGLKLQAVTKSWDGKTQVIKPLTLDVADGEFIVMVGPSGCGKSTLLRMVAGLERVTEGDIWINNERVTEMEPKDRGIAMVFQNYALYPHMSVDENMAWGLKMRAMGEQQIAERVSVPAGSASAWQWGARLCAIRRYFCLMSRSRTLMPSCACRCALSCSNCTVA